MTAIGLGTVFAALVSLVWAVGLVTRIVGRADNGQRAPSEPEAVRDEREAVWDEPAASMQPGGAPAELLHVALAAYSFHRQRQASTRSSTPTSPWSSAGRLRQISPFRD